MIESLKIVGLAILAAVVYGIIHDQITARICIEYFTIGHPRIFGTTESPTLLGIGWGIVATWWVGLILGIPLAICSRVGRLPAFSARQLLKPIAILLCVLFCLAMLAAMVGYFVAKSGAISLTGELSWQIPEARHALFLADLWAHLTSYGFGTLLGLGLCGWVLMARYRLRMSAKRG